MEEQQAGITALATAFARAYHATHDEPKIFNDWRAPEWFSAEEWVFFEKNMAGLIGLIDPQAAYSPEEALAVAMQRMNGPITLSRSRYAEDALEEAARNGVRQYVILGAGFDSFAFRQPEWAAGMEIYEIDHPATQTMKRQRIERAGWAIPANLHLISVDFTKEELSETLVKSGFDSHSPAFFSWLGVTYYLSSDAALATLRAVAQTAAAGSELVFDYMDREEMDPQKSNAQMRVLQFVVRQTGEPFKSGFDPAALPDELAGVGLRLVEDLDPAEIEARYFSGRADAYHAAAHVHLARAVVTE